MNGNKEITIWGILVGAILPLLGYFVVHWLATSRESSSRKAKAANDFRESIIRSMSKLPDTKSHWGSEVVAILPEVVQEVKTASEVFKYFLRAKERTRFETALRQLINLLNTHLPNSLALANRMYPGEQRSPQQVMTELMEKVEVLKSYADKT